MLTLTVKLVDLQMMERVKLVLKICSITKFSSLNKLINAFCKKEILNKMICELFSKY